MGDSLLETNKIHNVSWRDGFKYIPNFPNAKLILDPYMGIGTTAKAVLKCNEEDDGRGSCVWNGSYLMKMENFYKK